LAFGAVVYLAYANLIFGIGFYYIIVAFYYFGEAV
jgi:hypothetical protein